jgi:hypothetical protein
LQTLERLDAQAKEGKGATAKATAARAAP